MTWLPSHVVAVLIVCAVPVRPAGAALSPGVADTAAALAAQRAWWRAFVVADTAYLRARSVPTVSLTLSSGQTFGLDGMLAESASHSMGAQLAVTWTDEIVRLLTPAVAVVTSRVTEAAGPVSSVYRYVTVLERRGTEWRVAVAQSTREAAFARRTYAAVAAELADFAGTYRTPRGLALRVTVRDSALALTEPSGKELRLEPVGPGLFEFPALSPSNGVVRMLFTRDAAGRVTAFSQLAPGAVNTYPRVP